MHVNRECHTTSHTPCAVSEPRRRRQSPLIISSSRDRSGDTTSSTSQSAAAEPMKTCHFPMSFGVPRTTPPKTTHCESPRRWTQFEF